MSISPPAGPRLVAIPFGHLRPVAIKPSPQPPHSTTVSTIDPSSCSLPVASWFVPKRIALLRTRLPPQPNPHSRVRGALRAPSPSGSFFGGFRTLALARGSVLHGRHPKPCTQPVRLRASTSRLQFPREQTLLTHVSTSASCLGAFWSPAASARGQSRHPGDQKPAHNRTHAPHQSRNFVHAETRHAQCAVNGNRPAVMRAVSACRSRSEVTIAHHRRCAPQDAPRLRRRRAEMRT